MITSQLNYRYILMVFALQSELSQTVLTHKMNISIANICHIILTIFELTENSQTHQLWCSQ